MKVSVIIPCYNVADYITDCLDSVRAQTYPHLEVICVNNNSTDDTYQTIESCKKKYVDFPITLLNEPKPGASAARNAGLRIANGEWIQFLDADDLLESEKIMHQLELLKTAKDAALVAGTYYRQYQNGHRQLFRPSELNEWKALPQVSLGITSANLFCKDAVLSIDGWREDLKSSQEYDLMFRLLRAGAQVLFDQAPLTIVRERVSGSISQVDVLGNNLRRLEHLCEIRDYFVSAQFAQAYLDNVNQSIFQEIRRIYRIDARMAVGKYTELFKVKPKIRSTNGTSGSYVLLYNLLGFSATQRINAVFHRIKKP